ncbi:hypothetical protein L6164_020712 [Bauhinia variegata]|uniref:Uncharacterized protein n=1 Tax=Bauhinia variegata TaxID=167791 RepID=A0ACB9MX93_BAUVA|nr:hypothetical protein L6164_020712 [Bauhinia variegata]
MVAYGLFHFWMSKSSYKYFHHTLLILKDINYLNLWEPVLMANNDLKLLEGWFSPFVWRVKIALNIKSLDYEKIEETLRPKSDLLLQSNPVYKKIPVLIHGGKPICESAIIVEYIEETWTSGPSILSSDPYDRANARFWVAYIDDKLFPSMRSALATDEEAKKPLFEQIEEVLLKMEEVLLNKPFFGGDQIGLIDIVLGSLLLWLEVLENINERKLLFEEKTPALVKWAERFLADPAVVVVMPETDKLIEYAKAFRP